MDKNSRRSFLQMLGIGVAVVSARAVGASGNTCEVTKHQTSGPFLPNDFPIEISDDADDVKPPYVSVLDNNQDLTVVDDLKNPGLPKGQIIVIRGTVRSNDCTQDKPGTPVGKARVYMWQADAGGNYNQQGDTHSHGIPDMDANFQYRGIVETKEDGRFEFKTILPKYYPINPEGTVVRTAHLHFAVQHSEHMPIVTQTYFEGDVLEDIDRIRQLNKTDIILTRAGRILYPEMIVKFNYNMTVGVPVGEVTLTIEKLS